MITTGPKRSLAAGERQISEQHDPPCDALAGLELGGVPIATALSQPTGISTLFVRKQAKTCGTRRLAEGGEVAGRRLVVVQDVVTFATHIVESVGRPLANSARPSRSLCA